MKRLLTKDDQLSYLYFDNTYGGYIVRARHKDKPKPLWKSLEARTVGVARSEAKKIYSDWLGLLKGKDAIRFKDIAAKKSELKRNKAKSTRATFDYVVDHLLRFFGDMLVKDISETHWEEYLEDQLVRPVRKLDHDRRFFLEIMRYAFRKGYSSHLLEIPKMQSQGEVGKEFTDDEIDALLRNAKSDLRLRILMAVTMGMRKTEILKLSWGQIENAPGGYVDLKRGEIILPAYSTKTRTERVVEIHPIYVFPELAKRYLVRKSDFVFPERFTKDQPITTQERGWAACKRRAQVSGRFHDLRHTCASKLLRAGASTAQVGKILGMSETTLRRIYWHVSKEDRKAAANLIVLKSSCANACSNEKGRGKVLGLRKK